MRPVTFTRAIYRDLRGKRTTPRSDGKHLEAAIDWLYRSQDVTDCGGSAAYYSLLTGWAGSYPETSGYIVPTLYDYAEYADSHEARERADRMVSWLLEVQLDSGAFPEGVDPDPNEDPSVFNTGQILFGLVRAYEETGEEQYRSAAVQGAEWLISVQHEGGYWNRYDYKDEIHSYCSRVAWALLEVDGISEGSYISEARNHLDWVVSRQMQNGWFKNSGFSEKEIPYLHTIAYTIRGLIESGIYLNESKYLSSAQLASDRLVEISQRHNFLKGKYDSKWQGKNFYCLTGNIQMVINWLILYDIKKDNKYLNVSRSEFYDIKMYHDLTGKEIYGGMRGSYPVWDEYMRFRYPNWAVKFLIDAFIKFGEYDGCNGRNNNKSLSETS